jgi:hypothetical protein
MPTGYATLDRPSSKLVLARYQLILRLMLSLPALALALMCAATGAKPAEPIVLRTEAGRFSLRLTDIERPERVNHLHGFELSLITVDGRPATSASIVITGQHRYALNPLPTSPQVQPGPADGTYRIEGLRFHVAGEWRLVFAIEFEQIRDRATLDIVVK